MDGGRRQRPIRPETAGRGTEERSGGSAWTSRLAAMRGERAHAAGDIQRRHTLYRKASGEAGPAEIPTGAGQPLGEEVRRKMEPALGADLSAVRVHTGSDAARASSQLGARAFAVGRDVHFGQGQFAPGTKEGDRLLAHELTHTVQSARAGVQRKAEGGVSQPGDAAEREADAVADHVAESLHGSEAGPAPAVRSAAPAIGRKAEGEAKPAEAADPLAAELFSLAAPLGVTRESPLGKVALVLWKSHKGALLTAEEKQLATTAVNELDPQAFAALMHLLQLTGLLDTYLQAIGKDNAKKTVDQMATEVPVPAVAFGNVTRAQIEQHYQAANRILEKHNLKVTLGAFVQADQLLANEGGGEKLLGNPDGKIDGAALSPDDVGKYGELVGRIIGRLQTPGTLTSFWFAEIVKPYEGHPGLGGRAIREQENARFRGREAVFLDICGDETLFAHELGHVLGGKTQEAEHKEGRPEDEENVMFPKAVPGKKQDKLTPDQVQAFKTSIYGTISKAQAKPEDKQAKKDA